MLRVRYDCFGFDVGPFPCFGRTREESNGDLVCTMVDNLRDYCSLVRRLALGIVFSYPSNLAHTREWSAKARYLPGRSEKPEHKHRHGKPTWLMRSCFPFMHKSPHHDPSM